MTLDDAFAAPKRRSSLGGGRPDRSAAVCRILDYGKFKYQLTKRKLKPNAKPPSRR